MKKEIIFLIIFSLLFFSGLVWADNEVWNDAKDIEVGTFGFDEQPDTLEYTFISDVDFAASIKVIANDIIESDSDSSFYINLSNESSLNELEVSIIYAGNSNGNFEIIS